MHDDPIKVYLTVAKFRAAAVLLIKRGMKQLKHYPGILTKKKSIKIKLYV